MVNKIISDDYFDFLVENENLFLFQGYEAVTINFSHSIVCLPKEEVNMCSMGTYPYHVFPSMYALESTESLESSGVLRVRNNPNLGFRGQGILIGIVDTGIDYQHEAFLKGDGTSKIVSIWDQTQNEGGTPPENFLYGTEYDKTMIDQALKAPNPLEVVPSKDVSGHGTMLAGIVAGNPNASERFSGVVPDAELVIVKMKEAKPMNKGIFLIPSDRECYQETDIMFGVKYLLQVAEKLEQPMVICMALGSSQGGHDGYGALCRYLEYVTFLPRTGIAISAGNEGNKRRHYLGKLRALKSYDEFELKVGMGEEQFSMEIWQQVPQRLSVEIRSPSGEYISPIFPRIGVCVEHSFIFESSIVWVNNNTFESETGDQLILIRLDRPQDGIWTFKVKAIENEAAEFHVWLPSGELISDNTYFLQSNPDTTITSSANAIDPLTVTAYNTADGSIATFASRGYTRSGAIKPELAAPGVDIITTMVNNQYGTVSGTGVAAAHAAGIVAMVLEWAVIKGNFPSIKGYDVKKLLIRGAKRSPGTNYPNNVWGYGIIDVYGLFRVLTL